MQHKSLENGRWAELSFAQQMANIGSETYRVYTALEKGLQSRADNAFARAQELIDLTIRYGRMDDKTGRNAMLEELCRFREVFCGAVLSKDLKELSALNKYLDQFAKIRTI